MRLASSFVFAAVVCTGALLAGCPPDDSDDDDTPPRVLGVEPSSTIVPVTANFRVTLSESANPKTVTADLTNEDLLTVVLAPRFKSDGSLLVDDAFLSDLKNPPLTEARTNAVTPISATLEDRDSVIRVVPSQALRPNTAYVLIIGAEVRDTAGNPLVGPDGNKASFTWDFTTDGGQPAVVSTDIGSSHVVVANRRRITVTFNQPVVDVTGDTLRIDGSPAPNVEGILMDETATKATFLLGELGNGCARLGTSASYTLVATSGIRALNGQALADYSEAFTVSGTCDTTPNVLSGLTATAADVNASVRFSTTKPSTTEIRYGVQGQALDCLGAPCPVLGAATTTANALHSVNVDGLTVDVDYAFVVTAEDDVGAVARASGTFRTAPLPKVAVNEVLADTKAGFDDSDGEFVELASFEPTAPIDLNGWKLRTTKVNDAGAAPKECAFPSPAPTLQPGAFVVIADSSFDPDGTIYPGTDASTLFRFASFCGLQNEALLVELVDPAGRTVSSMTAPSPRTGRSWERISPDAPDEASSLCLSRDDTGPTPGRENSVTQRGCE
jgi:hypothetical protein